MSSKKFIILAIIGCLLTFGIYVVMMGFPLKSISIFNKSTNIILAQLSDNGAMNAGLYIGELLIMLSYIATAVMLFLKKAKAYIAQCCSILGAIVLEISLPSVPDGAASSIGFGFWILLFVSAAWTAALYYASRPKPASK